VQGVRSHSGAICRAGRYPHPPRHRRDPAIGRIAFDRSTLGSVIERLEAKDLVQRKPGSDDRRVKLLYLTKSGAALLGDIMASVDRAQARMLQPLKAADRKTLLALLTQLVDLNNEASRVPLRAEDAAEHLRKST